MTIGEFAKDYVDRFSAIWPMTRDQKDDVFRVIVDACSRGDKKDITSDLDALLLSSASWSPRNPGAYLRHNLKRYLDMPKRTRDRKPEAIAKEMAQDDKDFEFYPAFWTGKMKPLYPDYEYEWATKENLLKKHADDGQCPREPYLSNTWITLYQEAKQRGTSIAQLCRERGLDYRNIII